jgi:hypothetical protein
VLTLLSEFFLRRCQAQREARAWKSMRAFFNRASWEARIGALPFWKDAILRENEESACEENPSGTTQPEHQSGLGDKRYKDRVFLSG